MGWEKIERCFIMDKLEIYCNYQGHGGLVHEEYSWFFQSTRCKNCLDIDWRESTLVYYDYKNSYHFFQWRNGLELPTCPSQTPQLFGKKMEFPFTNRWLDELESRWWCSSQFVCRLLEWNWWRFQVSLENGAVTQGSWFILFKSDIRSCEFYTRKTRLVASILF